MVWNKNDPVLGFLLHDVSRMLRKRFDRRARDLGLTKSQWIVLAHLARHEGIHQSGLADILEIEPITLARHLDRLEDTGWVERQRAPNDRRAWNLHMTEKAGPILDELAVIVDETMEEALTGLPELDRTNLFDMLQAVRANLSERELEPNVDKKSNGIRAEHLT